MDILLTVDTEDIIQSTSLNMDTYFVTVFKKLESMGYQRRIIAKLLGMEERTMYRKINEFGLNTKTFRSSKDMTREPSLLLAINFRIKAELKQL